MISTQVQVQPYSPELSKCGFLQSGDDDKKYF